MALQKYSGIYKIINCINGKVYIGQSIDIKTRFYHHKRNALVKKVNHPLYDSIRCYGIDNFEFIIIEEIEDINKLDGREQYWLDHYKAYNRSFGYNLRTEAKSNKGCKHSEEGRKRNSESHKGKKLSEEHKKNISLSGLGKKHSEETKAKMAKSAKGKPKSEIAKKNMSLARKGIVPWNKGKKRPPFTEEHKKNMSLGKQGKKLSEEHKRKIGLAHKGKIISEDTKNKLSEKIINLWKDSSYVNKVNLGRINKRRNLCL
mgnify:FL=1